MDFYKLVNLTYEQQLELRADGANVYSYQLRQGLRFQEFITRDWLTIVCIDLPASSSGNAWWSHFLCMQQNDVLRVEQSDVYNYSGMRRRTVMEINDFIRRHNARYFRAYGHNAFDVKFYYDSHDRDI